MYIPPEHPRVIIISPADSDTCTWLSDGWFMEDQRHEPAAQRLYNRVRELIGTAENVTEAVRLLIGAGFEVTWVNASQPDVTPGCQ